MVNKNTDAFTHCSRADVGAFSVVAHGAATVTFACSFSTTIIYRFSHSIKF